MKKKLELTEKKDEDVKTNDLEKPEMPEELKKEDEAKEEPAPKPPMTLPPHIGEIIDAELATAKLGVFKPEVTIPIGQMKSEDGLAIAEMHLVLKNVRKNG